VGLWNFLNYINKFCKENRKYNTCNSCSRIPLSNFCCHAWFQASFALLMRYALFWYITQRRVVIPYRRCRTTYRSLLQGSSSLRRLADPSRWYPIGCPETSVWNDNSTLCEIPEACILLAPPYLRICFPDSTLWSSWASPNMVQRLGSVCMGLCPFNKLRNAGVCLHTYFINFYSSKVPNVSNSRLLNCDIM
jgi:hypothetical protein